MSEADFNKAAEEVKQLKKKPSDDQLLELYGLFKRSLIIRIVETLFSVDFFFPEATVGDNNTAQPGMFDLKGKYKWEAWNKVKGTSVADARQKYIDLVAGLKGNEWNLNGLFSNIQPEEKSKCRRIVWTDFTLFPCHF